MALGIDFSKIWNNFSHHIVDVWKFKLIEIGGAQLTVGKIVIALTILLVGLRLSRRLSRMTRNRLLNRVMADRGAQAAVESMIYYILIVFFVVFSMRIASIPLTVFTILGGALAIGVGFGSQNLINNFISGLIMLIERPIKVGDAIDVDGTLGSVVKIGVRSTQIRTASSVDILVPNSSFLEKNVINWTLADNRVRESIVIGVAYGSDINKVAELLKQAALENDSVQNIPEPIVLFNEFGESSLDFEVLFWIVMREHIDRRKIKSDLRFAIYNLLNAEGVTISFPQRDLHLNTLSPLDIKIINSDS